ncbi:MAG: DUF6186 family protein [Actinomycetota bacterium]
MSTHAVTITGYLVIALTGIALEWFARRGSGRIPRFSDVVSRATRTRVGRVGVMAGWAWLGLHFFAR